MRRWLGSHVTCGGGKWEEPPHTCMGLHTERQRLGQAPVCVRSAEQREREGKSRAVLYTVEAASTGYVRSR